MKKIGVSVLSVFMLLFFASEMQAQAQSAENSNVILENQWISAHAWFSCPSTGEVFFDVDLHILTKMTPSGKWSHFIVAKGEGVDDSGGIWTWHDTWNRSSWGDEEWHATRTLTARGPDKVKLQMKVVYIIKDGELVQYKVDPLCE